MKESRLFRVAANPLAIALFLGAVLTVITSATTMGNDEGMWTYIGRIWSDHRILPYTGAVENKPPAIFELNAISYMLFGVNTFFVRTLGIAAIVGASLIVYRIGKAVHSDLAGVLGMWIFGLVMAWDQMDGLYIAQTETFMVFFAAVSFYCIITSEGSRHVKFRILTAGISIGLALAFKQIALTTLAALIFFMHVWPAVRPTRRQFASRLVLLFSGIAAATAASLLPLLIGGVTLKEYIDGAWLILLHPGSRAPMEHRVLGFFNLWQDARIVIVYPGLILLLMQTDLAKNRVVIGLLAWLALDFLGANSSGYYYGHQIKQIVPALAVVLGISLSNLLSTKTGGTDTDRMKYAPALLLAVVMLLFPYRPLLKAAVIGATGYSTNHDKEIGVWLKEKTEKGDCVYIIGDNCNQVLSYSGRISSSRLFNAVFVTSDTERDALLADLEARPPRYFLMQPGSFTGTRIADFIGAHYAYQRREYNYEVYSRR